MRPEVTQPLPAGAECGRATRSKASSATGDEGPRGWVPQTEDRTELVRQTTMSAPASAALGTEALWPVLPPLQHVPAFEAAEAARGGKEPSETTTTAAGTPVDSAVGSGKRVRTPSERSLRTRVQLPTKSTKAVATGEGGTFTSIYRGVTRHRLTGRYEAHFWDAQFKREKVVSGGGSRRGTAACYEAC